jgi:hypothetical protein
MLIDVHAHQFPDQYAQQMAQHGRPLLGALTDTTFWRTDSDAA